MQALINRIIHYGSRRLEDFDKYEAVRLAEELVFVAKTTSHAIATTLREKIHVSKAVKFQVSRLTSWLFWQIRSSQGSLLPSLNVLRRTFVHSLEVIRGFLLPILESPAIAAGPPATSLHNVRVTTNPGRQLSRTIYPTPNLYKFGLYES